ncbi:unnamed protein product [Durusdinium trenchii]
MAAWEPFRQLCIVGAGPAGLQLGHFLSQDTSEILRDFVIFEKSSSAGSFFRRFPIHRMLISLNKRNVARGGMDFRMRHDWNSLLGADTLGIAPMTARTTELYPHADVLVQYLRDYAVHLSGHIRFNTKVVRLSREDEHFHLEIQSTNASGEQRAQRLVQRCGLVVLAVGLTPSLPQDVVGSHLLTGYEELEPSGSAYENRSVLVWGFGNAAHETARELQKYTQAVTLLHRERSDTFDLWKASSSALPRFAFFTHYPGDVRTVTMQIYDSYLLKALDVKLPYSSQDEEPVFLPCPPQLCVWVSKRQRCAGGGFEGQILPLRHVRATERRECVVEVGPLPLHAERQLRRRLRTTAVEGRDFVWRGATPRSWRAEQALTQRLRELGFGSLEEYLAWRNREGQMSSGKAWHEAQRLEVSSAFLEREPSFLQLVARLRPSLGIEPLRFPVDVAVRCLGWKANLMEGLEVFTGKYPPMDASYQSVTMPGLYFAGAVSHGRDYRRSAGGFIHGFRYTARALHRILQQRGCHGGWPNRSFQVAEHGWMQQVLERVNEAAGPYQMFGELVDVVLFFGEQVQYLEEQPLAFAQEQFKMQPRLLLSFVYGRRFSATDLPSPGAIGVDFGELSAFLHPRLELFGPCEGPGHCPPNLSHAMVEDVYTDWHSWLGHVDPLFGFLQACADRAAKWLSAGSAGLC